MKSVYFIAIVAFAASCRSTRPIQTVIAKKDTVAVDNAKADSARFIKATLNGLKSNRINFTTFSAKVNVDYRGSDGKNYDVNANIKMYRDSAIWISVNAVLGIEAMRALVTKDSIKLMDKLNKVYTARSVDYLQEVTALPLDLYILQDLILGNPVFLDSNVVSYSRTPGAISVLSLGRLFKSLVTVAEDNQRILQNKLDDVDVTRNRTADLVYEDYETKKGPLFATKRRITISEKKKLDIKLDFKQYEFNSEVSFPFTVPKNYEQR
jgi:hypothetical protein